MKIKYLFSLMSANLFLLLNKVNVYATGGIFDLEDPLENVRFDGLTNAANATGNFYKYAMVSVNGFAGIGIFTSVLAFAINAFKFSRANSKERAEAVSNMLTIAITTACLGSVPVIVWVVSLIAGLS